MANPVSISLIVAAYNEAPHLEEAVRKYRKAVLAKGLDYEIIVFDDGSRDTTGEIADRLAAQDPHLRVVHNPSNQGLGFNFREGVRLADKEYCMLLGGEGDVYGSSVQYIVAQAGKADIVVPYVGNPEVRPGIRRLISRLYTALFNISFRMSLRYYNGCALFRRTDLDRVPMTTDSFACQAEVLVRLVRAGKTVLELPYIIRKTRGSTSFRPRNVSGVLKTWLRLWVRLMVLRRSPVPVVPGGGPADASASG